MLLTVEAIEGSNLSVASRCLTLSMVLEGTGMRGMGDDGMETTLKKRGRVVSIRGVIHGFTARMADKSV